MFGRSQRETACECERSYAPNLAQMLHLMNSSEIQNKLIERQGAAVVQLAASGKSSHEMVEELYLVTYGRLPDEAEMAEATELPVDGEGREAALGDLTWVLLNTKEFLFNH